jgi:glutamate formiminotransferase/formiminotetrahydrofolate cyclodeaminase
LRAQGKSPFVPVADVLEAAVFSMGLADVQPFDLKKKVLGLPREVENGLASLSVRAFADEVSRDTPAPGGGSIAALSGALGAGLASMVANLSYGKGEPEHDVPLLHAAQAAQIAKDALLLAIDDDTNAFHAYMDARRLPVGTDAEKASREAAMQHGLQVAVEVPLETARVSLRAMHAAWATGQHGNPKSLTDAAVGVQMGFAGVCGGVWNA